VDSGCGGAQYVRVFDISFHHVVLVQWRLTVDVHYVVQWAFCCSGLGSSSMDMLPGKGDTFIYMGPELIAFQVRLMPVSERH
jgi:hypothetical protein